MEALRRRPDLRVLYTTGYAPQAILRNSTLDGDMHLLTKPFSMAALATKLHKSMAAAR